MQELRNGAYVTVLNKKIELKNTIYWKLLFYDLNCS